MSVSKARLIVWSRTPGSATRTSKMRMVAASLRTEPRTRFLLSAGGGGGRSATAGSMAVGGALHRPLLGPADPDVPIVKEALLDRLG